MKLMATFLVLSLSYAVFGDSLNEDIQAEYDAKDTADIVRQLEDRIDSCTALCAPRAVAEVLPNKCKCDANTIIDNEGE